MLSKLSLITISSLFIGTFYYRYKQQYFKNLFENVKKCEKYHLDYIDELKRIPVNRKLMLFGTVDNSKLNSQQIIIKSYIRKSTLENRFWRVKINEQFYLKTAFNETIVVKALQNDYNFAFNWINKPIKDDNLELRAIIAHQPICVYGKFQKKTQSRVFRAQIILGSQHQSFLTFLDKQIMLMNSRGKILATIGTIILVTHALYTYNYNQKHQIRKLPTLNE